MILDGRLGPQPDAEQVPDSVVGLSKDLWWICWPRATRVSLTNSSQERAAPSEVLIMSFSYLKFSPSARGRSPYSLVVQEAFKDPAPFSYPASSLSPLPHSLCSTTLSYWHFKAACYPLLYAFVHAVPSTQNTLLPTPICHLHIKNSYLTFKRQLRSIFSRSFGPAGYLGCL